MTDNLAELEKRVNQIDRLFTTCAAQKEIVLEGIKVSIESVIQEQKNLYSLRHEDTKMLNDIRNSLAGLVGKMVGGVAAVNMLIAIIVFILLILNR